MRARLSDAVIPRPRCGVAPVAGLVACGAVCGGGAARNVGAVGESELIGRRREMACLRGWLVAAAEGEPRLVLCGGEPGIGKTRLASELAEVASAGLGARVVWARRLRTVALRRTGCGGRRCRLVRSCRFRASMGVSWGGRTGASRSLTL